MGGGASLWWDDSGNTTLVAGLRTIEHQAATTRVLGWVLVAVVMLAVFCVLMVMYRMRRGGDGYSQYSTWGTDYVAAAEGGRPPEERQLPDTAAVCRNISNV